VETVFERYLHVGAEMWGHPWASAQSPFMLLRLENRGIASVPKKLHAGHRSDFE